MGTKRPAQSELFRNNLQKIWVRRAGGTSSSVRTVCDPELIVHFQSFLKTSVILYRGRVGVGEGNNSFVLQVDPKSWALAFLQWDLTDATEILCEAVFTKIELEARDAASEKTAKLDCLNVIKRRATIRAVLWMQNKNQDPWGYEASSDLSNINASDTELSKINQGFLNFKKIEPLPKFLLSEPFESELGGPPGAFQDPQTNGTLSELLTQKLDSILSLNEAGSESAFAPSFEEVFETVWGLVVSERRSVVLRLYDLQDLTTPAQILKELTLYMIRDLNEVFVGAVQFDRTQFAVLERRRNAGFAQMVRSLFRMLYRRYNGNTPDSDPQLDNSKFKNFREDKQAAVLLLSIIRILKFMCQFEDKFEDKAHDFIETTANPFPNKSEMQEVFKVLKEVCVKKFEDEDSGMDQCNQSEFIFDPCIPVPSSISNAPTSNDDLQTMQITIMDSNETPCQTHNLPNLNDSNQVQPLQRGRNPEELISYTNMDINSISEQQNSISTITSDSSWDWNASFLSTVPEHPQGNVNPSGNGNNGMLTSELSNLFQNSPSPINSSAFAAINITSPPFIPTLLSYEADSFNITDVNGQNPNSSQQIGVSYQISPAMTQANSINNFVSNASLTKQLKYNIRSNDEGATFISVVLMDYPEYEFNLDDLTQAYSAVQGAMERRGGTKVNPQFEGGKELFRRMFSQEEIDSSNLKGRRAKNNEERRGFFKDPILKYRSNALLDILPILEAMVKEKQPVVPAVMPPENVISMSIETNELARNDLIRKIFAEFRYQRATKTQ